MIMIQKLNYAGDPLPFIDKIMVVAERDIFPAQRGDMGIVVRVGEGTYPRFTIKFANGNTGMDYPSLKFMVDYEIREDNYSFYYVEIKPKK